MEVNGIRMTYERRWSLLNGKIFMVDFTLNDPTGRLNYASVSKRANRPFRVSVGWKPSPSHHYVIGDYETAAQALNRIIEYIGR